MHMYMILQLVSNLSIIIMLLILQICIQLLMRCMSFFHRDCFCCQIPEHMKHVCEKAVLQCDFYTFGCLFQVQSLFLSKGFNSIPFNFLRIHWMLCSLLFIFSLSIQFNQNPLVPILMAKATEKGLIQRKRKKRLVELLKPYGLLRVTRVWDQTCKEKKKKLKLLRCI